MAGRLYLDVRADNTPALTLYEALGFEELDPPAWPVPAFMRGSFAMTQACLPHMLRGGFGRVVTMSPPITTAVGAFAGKTAYCISKFGMTMCALGAAAEGRGRGVTGNSLWPATVIESLAAINFKLGDKSQWRKATILADAVVEICESGDDFSGNMLIDDDFLRSRGWSDADIARSRSLDASRARGRVRARARVVASSRSPTLHI